MQKFFAIARSHIILFQLSDLRKKKESKIVLTNTSYLFNCSRCIENILVSFYTYANFSENFIENLTKKIFITILLFDTDENCDDNFVGKIQEIRENKSNNTIFS